MHLRNLKELQIISELNPKLILPKFQPIEKAKNLIAKHRFDLKSLQKIGEGSDRKVYAIDEDTVIKVAKTKRGLGQNDSEGDWVLGMIPELLEKGKDYVVVKRIPRDDKRSNQMLKPLKKFSIDDWENKTSELQKAIFKLDEQYPDSGFKEIMSYDLVWRDFTFGRNWGWKDNKPYLLDAGTLNKSIFEERHLNYLTPEWEQIKSQRRTR